MPREFQFGMPLAPEREDEIIEKIAQWTVKYEMELPALLLAQTIQPLAGFMSQMGVFYGSAWYGLLPQYKQYGEEVITLFERPENYERLMKRIEELNKKAREEKEAAKRAFVETHPNESLRQKLKRFFTFHR